MTEDKFVMPVVGEFINVARAIEICEYFGVFELMNKIKNDPPVSGFTFDG